VSSIEIVPFRAEHAAAFYSLNRAWLEEHGLFEPRVLAAPASGVGSSSGASSTRGNLRSIEWCSSQARSSAPRFASMNLSASFIGRCPPACPT
jgi:hypothetical protein